MAQPQNTSLTTVQHFFKQHEAQLIAALPKHLNADRMARLALTALSQSRKLSECDAKSIFGAVIMAAQLGLEIGVLGQGYLVPYKGRATFIPGWQGLVSLVGRAGKASCWTGAVFDGDEFDWAMGDRPFVTHRPAGEFEPDRMTHAYAVGRVQGSEWPVIEVWPMTRVWAHRDRHNKVGSDHYSYIHPEMYARKVVLLQVLKYLPKSVEISAAMEMSYRGDSGKPATLDGNFQVIDDEPEDSAAGLTDDIAAKAPQKRTKAVETEKPAPTAAEAGTPAPAAPGESGEAKTPPPSLEQNHYMDMLLLVQDATTVEEVDAIGRMDMTGFRENQVKALMSAIHAKKTRLEKEASA